MTPTGFTPLFSTGDACKMIPGATPANIEFFVLSKVLLPAQPSTGRGVKRRFSMADLIQLHMALQLQAAGLSVPQLEQLFWMLRAKLSFTPVAERECALLRDYIETSTMLAQAFGPGPGFNEWLTAATAHLTRMEQFAQARAARTTRTPEAAIDDEAATRKVLVGLARLPPHPVKLRAS
jgi:DNA-binding transcriptional MerR regulator